MWPTRDSLDPTPLAEYLLHRHRARSSGAASKRCFQSVLVPWRAARARVVTCRTSRPPTDLARSADLARLSLRPTRNALHLMPLVAAPLHRHRARSADAGLETLNLKVPSSMARGPRALHPVENQPTAHRARTALRTWRGCLRSQLATLSTPRRWPRLSLTDTAPGRRLQLENDMFRGSYSVACGPRALRHMKNQPPDHRARAHCGLGAVVFAANSQRAPAHAVDRSFAPLTPRGFDGCGFKTP